MKSGHMTVLMTIIAIGVGAFLVIYWQQSSSLQKSESQIAQSQQQAVNLVANNSCSDSAKGFFENWKSTDLFAQTLHANESTPSLTIHYNKSTQECLIRIDGMLFHNPISGGLEYEDVSYIYDVQSKNSLVFMDALFHKENYQPVFDSVKCSFVSGQSCSSVDSFEKQAQILMTQ